MIKKILSKPFLYFFIISICYFLLLLFLIFIVSVQDILTQILFSNIFIIISFVNCYFLNFNYDKFCNYTTSKKIISAVIAFLVVDIFGKLVENHLLQNIYLSLFLSFFALVFSFMFILLSALSKNRFGFFSKILYYVGIGTLFIANLMAIINMFTPFV